MAKEVIIRVKGDTKDLEKGLDTSAKKADNVGNSLDKVGGKLGLAVGAVRGFVGGIRSAVVGMKTLKGAIAATGIGLLLVAFGSLTAFFTKTERGAQALRVVTAALGAAFDVVSDVIVSVGESIFGFFTDLGKKISALIEPIMSSFKSVASFLGIYEESTDSAKEATESFVDEIIREAKEAARLQKVLNDVKVTERELRVERAKSQAQINELRLLAEDRTKSEADRIDALQKAFEIEDGIAQKELENERKRVEAIQARINLGESSEEDFENLADAQVRLANIEASSLQRNRALFARIQAIRQEEASKQEARAKAEEERAQKEQERLQKIREDEEKAALAEEERLSKLADAELALDNEKKLRLADNQREFEILKAEIDFEARQKELESLEASEQEKANLITKLEEEKAAALNSIKDKFDEQDKQRQKIATENAINAAQGVFSGLSQLAEQGSAEFKAIKTFETIVSTISAAQKAFEQGTAVGGPILGIAQAAIASAIGLKNIQAINSAKKTSKSAPSVGGGGGGGGGRTPNFQEITPREGAQQVEVTNQREQEPIKAFVLEGEVTNSQQKQKKLDQIATLN